MLINFLITISNIILFFVPITISWYIIWNLYLYKFDLIRDFVFSIKNSLKKRFVSKLPKSNS
jgi:hypothetical protein